MCEFLCGDLPLFHLHARQQSDTPIAYADSSFPANRQAELAGVRVETGADRHWAHHAFCIYAGGIPKVAKEYDHA